MEASRRSLKEACGFGRSPWPLAIGLTGLGLVAHAGVAWLTELSPDETYYALWSRQLAWSYPDHPPAVAGLIALGEAIFGPGKMAVRAPALLVALLVPWVLAFAVARVRGAAAARRLLWLLHATILLHALGIITTPDTPLSLAWAFALAALLLLLGRGGPAPDTSASGRWPLLVGLGLAMGGAILSKLTGWFLLAGVLGAFLQLPTLRRRLGGGPGLTLALLVAIAVASPWGLSVLLAPGDSDLAFQLARLSPRGQPLQHLLAYLGGQAGLLTPGVLGLTLLWAWRALLPGKGHERDPIDTLLLWLGIPLPLVLLAVALVRPVEANWVGPVWLAALLGAASVEVSARAVRRVVGSGLALALLAHLLAGSSPWLPLLQTGSLARLSGWRALAAEVEAVCGEGEIEAQGYALGSELRMRLRQGRVRVRVVSEARRAFFRNEAVGAPPACVVFDCRRGPRPPTRPAIFVAIVRPSGAPHPRVCILAHRRAPPSAGAVVAPGALR